MRKKVIVSIFLLLIGVGIITPPSFAYAAGCTTQAEKEACAKAGGTCKFASVAMGGNWYCSIPSEEAGKSSTAVGWAASAAFNMVLKLISEALIIISSGILTMVGALFDSIIDYTITKMADQINNTEGIGQSINVAWATIRDVANMFFIFILLYAAFKALFSLNISGSGTIIRNIIIAALLINFSLFLTKVVIDASNVVSIGFYKAIVSTNVQSTNASQTSERTIASGYMRLIGLQSWYDTSILTQAQTLNGLNILVVGVMSSIFFLITAVIFLVTAVMFVARFIILIFVMILSPLAVVAAIIPSGTVKGHFDKWKEALTGQAVFAPVFFAMTWVAITVASKVLPTLSSRSDTVFVDLATKPPSETKALILNYVIVIGFAVAALVVAKQVASKTMGFGAISGGIGTAAFGGTAWASRKVIGGAASRLAESRGFRDWASRSKIGELALKGTEKTARSSFDVRALGNTKWAQKVGADKYIQDMTSITGKAGGEGGYNKMLEKQIEKKEKTAQMFRTDAQKAAYAARQVSGLGTLYARGGSRPWNKRSLFGTLGRSNRIVAAKILGNQLQQLTQQRDTLRNNEQNEQGRLQNLQNRDSQLNQQLNAAQANLIALRNLPQTPQTAAQINQIQNNINNVQNQIMANNNLIAQSQTQLQNIQAQINLVNNQVQNLDNQMDTFGIRNPANMTQLTPLQQLQNQQAIAAGRQPPHISRPSRADEQNY